MYFCGDVIQGIPPLLGNISQLRLSQLLCTRVDAIVKGTADTASTTNAVHREIFNVLCSLERHGRRTHSECDFRVAKVHVGKGT